MGRRALSEDQKRVFTNYVVWRSGERGDHVAITFEPIEVNP
jgi:hypothetical protein